MLELNLINPKLKNMQLRCVFVYTNSEISEVIKIKETTHLISVVNACI